MDLSDRHGDVLVGLTQAQAAIILRERDALLDVIAMLIGENGGRLEEAERVYGRERE